MLLQLKNISKKFRISKKESLVALNDINLTFDKGEFVSIVGPSGSGKSTLLNLIAGLDTPTTGELLIGGKSSRKFKKGNWDLYRKNNVGFIFQNFNLIEHLTAIENVEIVMNLIGLKISERKKRAYELLEKVGLESHAHHRPSELSGGQKQRVAIARALANDPDIILADEPTGSLDKKTGSQIMELIASIAKDKLIIMVTHNHVLADTYSSRIIKMKDGLIESDESMKEIEVNNDKSSLKKRNKSMSFYESFKLSLRNMGKKKGRIAITTLAGSIGIAGFALILGLGNGANIYIDKQLNKFADANLLIVKDNVKEKNELGQEIIMVSDNEKDYSKIFNNKDIVAHRPFINLSSSVVSVAGEGIESAFHPLADEDHLNFLKENMTGELPKGDKVITNQSSAREILKKLKIDSDNPSDAIGKKVSIAIKIVDMNMKILTFTKEFTISGIANDIDLGIKKVYYNYDDFSLWLKDNKVGEDTVYTYLTKNNGFEVTLKNVSDNKKVSDYINAEANGGIGTIGNIMSQISGNKSSKEGFIAYSMPIVFKMMFAQLISIAQIVISLFIIVALVVSSIMTSIVLYSSVVERKTEIGIIKAVGGRDKDVLRIFESEAMLMGAFSGIAGIVIAYLLSYPIEYFIANYFGLHLPGIVSIPLSTIPFTNIVFPLATIISLILFSALVAALAGYLPSRRATKMQVIDALRDE